MWTDSASPSTSKYKIPPNFTLHDVLEPQRLAIPKPNVKVENLIDLNTDEEHSGKHAKTPPDNNISVKKDFDLVDLYENMMVTPYHVTKKYDTKIDNDFDFSKSQIKGNCDLKREVTNDMNKTLIYEDYDAMLDRVIVSKTSAPRSDVEEEIFKRKELLEVLPNKNQMSSGSLRNLNVLNVSHVHNINIIATEDLQKREKPAEIIKIFVLHTLRKDQKQFVKKFSKTDLEKTSLTKGPTLYEKSIVLPQIMQRLYKKKALHLDEKVKRRLILDAGPSGSQIVNAPIKPSKIIIPIALPTPNPIAQTKRAVHSINSVTSQVKRQTSDVNEFKVLNADCNRSKLIDLKHRQMFKNFVMTGKYE